MDNTRLGKALDIMRLAEEAAARPGGISLVQIVDTFGVTLRTAQRLSRALEDRLPDGADPHRQGTAQVVATARQPPLLHMQGIRDSELSALDMGIRRAERDGAATTEVARALTSLRNRLLGNHAPELLPAAPRSMPRPCSKPAATPAAPAPARSIRRMSLARSTTALKGPFTIQIDYAGGAGCRATVAAGRALRRAVRHARLPDRPRDRQRTQVSPLTGWTGSARASLLQDSFVRDPDFDLGKHAARAFGSFHSEAEYGPVEWRFAPIGGRSRPHLPLPPRPTHGSRRGRRQL
jgi:hypothetical protein